MNIRRREPGRARPEVCLCDIRGLAEFLDAERLTRDAPTAQVACRRIGQGPPLVFLHGWPLSGFTFRKLLPLLKERFTCYLIDLPGGGDTEWTKRTEFSWPAQAATVKAVLEGLRLESYALFGQDSGAMIARHLCLLDRRRVTALIMTNTEVPGHRPPLLPIQRGLLFLPSSGQALRLALGWRWLVRSRWGFGASLRPELVDDVFYQHTIHPLVLSERRMDGQVRFLKGWSWGLLDRWEDYHRSINVPVRLIWGGADIYFPLAQGKRLRMQLPQATLSVVQGAHLLVHEEEPEQVAAAVINHLSP